MTTAPTHLVVEADGGSRGNPGPAGSGSLIRDRVGGSVLQGVGVFLGEATNNVAEYRGLITGLTLAREAGARSVQVRLDSKLVVEQMSGRWKVKHPDMKPLAAQAQALVREFDSVEFQWIPRKDNALADELANLAMDAGQAGAAVGTTVTAPGAESDTAPAPAQPAATADAPATDQDTACAPAWTGSTASLTPTRLILLRHGRTAMSAARQLSGHSDVPLDEQGQAQAAAAAARLAARGRIDAIVASPLQRCQQTAAAVAAALHLEVATEEGLKECCFGDWEGLTFTEAHDADPQRHSRWLADPTIAPPGGESLTQLHERVLATRDDLIDRYGQRTIVVVSHVGPIKSLLRCGLGAPAEIVNRIHLDLASISMVDFYADGNSVVRLVNDTNHLVGVV